MLDLNNQYIESSEIVFDKVSPSKTENRISKAFTKFKSLEVELIKIYLGIEYFLLSSLALALLFLS